MTLSEAMRDYYSGQRYVALSGALVAMAYLLLAKMAYSRKTHPGRSFAITVFIMAGLFMLPANIAYFFYIGPQSGNIGAVLARNPDEFLASENAQLDKMMMGFHSSYRMDSVVALLGLAAAGIGFGLKNRKAVGAGLAIFLCSTTLLSGEVWSKQRALHYRGELAETLHPH